jgi:mannose-6-phosphate isomerase
MRTFSSLVARARRLLPTRVYRFYRGGALLGRLGGREEEDGSFPEDWVGSVTEANNPGRDEPEAGLSRLEDGTLLADAVTGDPETWLGAKHVERFGVTTGLLVKLLDAAERLPVHAHPDRRFAQAHFGSSFGKTEAWIVVATRSEESEVWVGLREPVDPATYRGWIEAQDRDALLEALNRVPVRAGDVAYVPAGLPHAIGAGVLIAELQEPTDFSIVCEWEGFPIEPEDSHLGLGWDAALDALDLDAHTPVLRLPEDARAFFWADEVVEPAGRFAVLLVLEGEGEIDGQAARAGDRFAVPAGARDLSATGSLRVLRCLAPEPD